MEHEEKECHDAVDKTLDYQKLFEVVWRPHQSNIYAKIVESGIETFGASSSFTTTTATSA